MTTFSIRGYKVEEFIGSDKPVCIFMYEDGCDFRDYNKFGQYISFSPNSNSTMYPNGIIDAYMPLIKLHPTLDMLRSDKLLNFSVIKQYNKATPNIIIEPIGKEEISESYS